MKNMKILKTHLFEDEKEYRYILQMLSESMLPILGENATLHPQMICTD